MSNNASTKDNKVEPIFILTKPGDPEPPTKTNQDKDFKDDENKRIYVSLAKEVREQLIHAVEKDGITIKDAAASMNINYSTAKHIMKQYKAYGIVETQV